MMRLILLLMTLLAVAACQTPSDDGPGNGYSRSNANKALADDPVAALKKY